ncbi:MAG: cytochrome P450 [Chloroflexi bacterium]|nr:cytochrome P450 [Chloroflexota bacterium]MCY3589298.1 cytochrome P450 [Chloroflexota bacterium]MCY3686383.1 cytochrome P450 [Chloroflexota bacterium]MDE2708107.1 cytochrome P450 [Chloroflexota bacterium]
MVLAESARLTVETVDITDSDRYRDHGYPWAEWDLLRREAPVYWYQRPGFEPFWAITRHSDIRFISAHPELFSNSQMLRLNTAEKLTQQQTEREFQTNRHGGDPSDPQDFIWMDPPEHRQHRGIVARHFTPRVMKTLEDHFAELADDYVSDFADKVVASFAERGADSAVDVVHELSAKLPVAAICDMGGVPEEDWEKIFEWTEAFAGQDDPEYWEPGENSFQATQRVVQQWFRHTQGLIEERHRNGFGDDLLSDLLRAEIDGRKLTADEVHNYFFLLLGAGNETTRNAITGGVKALLDHPEQMQMLVEDESLVPSAVEEILRWTSIVIQFQRTAVEDVELGGQLIRKGESVVLWYPSANRDEEIFEDPYKFDITRTENDHFAFGGYGEHFCLGANLARWEMRSIFHALRPMLPQLEIAADPEYVISFLHVGGIKRQMVRYRPA